jgi:chorismate synthase
MNKTPDNPDMDARRKSARRTALWVAAIAVAIYAVFILSGVMSK